MEQRHREHFWVLLLFTMQNMYLVLFIFILPSYTWKNIDSHVINEMAAKPQELKKSILCVHKKDVYIRVWCLRNTYKYMSVTFKKGYFFHLANPKMLGICSNKGQYF